MVNWSYFQKISLSPVIKYKRSHNQQRTLALIRLILSYLALALCLLLNCFSNNNNLRIALLIIAIYATVMYFYGQYLPLFTKKILITLLFDELAIFIACYYSGGLTSPFIPVFLFPVLALAVNPSYMKLIAAMITSILGIFLLGVTTQFILIRFLYLSIYLFLSGIMVYVLAYKDFQVFSAYAVKDGLTGLYTHQYFFDYLNIVMTSNPEPKPFSLIMMDLDEFKKLNDELGHLEGDRILKEVAAVIKQNVRDSDIVARYGGDEFALILPGVGHDLNTTIIARLRNSIIDMGYFDDVSIGSALYPDDETDMYKLVNLADQRMYDEKRLSKLNPEV